MADASVPQNDRELLLKLDGKIDQFNGEISRLSQSITDFNTTIREIEETKIAGLDKRLKVVENVWQQVSGGWKLVLVIWSILTAGGLVGLLLQFISK